MGGQAVLEGVMMRGASTWAVAVRDPEGEIRVDVHDVPGWSERYRHIPVLRGVMGLAESLGLGYRALIWSGNQQVPPDKQVSDKVMGWSVAAAVAVFSVIFILLPALAGHSFGHLFHGSFPLFEGLARLGIFLIYLLAISRLRDIRRVFQYHGAEHKVIAAYENGVELTPETAQQFSTEHVRCGTNFLLTVMIVAILVYAVVPRPNLLAVVASRFVLIPVIAGISYELIRWSAKHMDLAIVRAIMRPGLLLQRLTTRNPDLDQLEVAIVSLRAVMSADQIAEVDGRIGLRIPAIAPAI
jgi:uncharacterized protein YqhQ